MPRKMRIGPRAKAAPRRRIQAALTSGSATNQNKSTTPYQPRPVFMNKPYARPRIGMPNTSSQVIRKSYSTFTKDKEYDKKKALDFFSATKNFKYALPLANSLGVFSCSNFSRRQALSSTTVAGNSVYVVITFTPSQLCGFTYTQVGTTATAVANITAILFPDMNSTPPQNMRNSRMTVTLLNTTSSTNVAGAVSTIFVNNGLDYDFSSSTTAVELSVAFQNEIATMIDTNTKSRIHGAANFIGEKENQMFSLIPSSYSNLEEWLNYSDAAAPDATANIKAALINGSKQFSHSTLIMRLEPTTVQNSYTLLINGQYALRWPANSILSSIGQNDQKSYVNKNLVERHAGTLNGDGHVSGGGVS